MADKKISELTEHTTPIGNDVLPIVDTTAGTTKKIKVSNLIKEETGKIIKKRTNFFHFLPVLGDFSNASGTDQIYVNCFTDQVSDYGDFFVARHNYTVSGGYYRLLYFKRNTTTGEPYVTSALSIVNNNQSQNSSNSGGFILGNYVYFFDTVVNVNTFRCVRMDKETLSNYTAVTIGAGGGTIAVRADYAAVTDGTYIYIKTTTSNVWNKYSVNGTTLVYVSATTMNTALAYGSEWNYVSASTSWIKYGREVTHSNTNKWMEIKIDRTTLLSNTTEKYEQTYTPVTIGAPSSGTVCKQISVSAMRVVDDIYDLVVADITSYKGGQIAAIHSRPVKVPTTFA